MKSKIFIALTCLGLAFSSCQNNQTRENTQTSIKSENPVKEKDLLDHQDDLQVAFEELEATMEKRVNDYRSGKHELTSADSVTVEKLKVILERPMGEVLTSSIDENGEPMLKGCGWLKKAACSAAIAAAVVACGGPEDLPCIAAALGALSGCIECL